MRTQRNSICTSKCTAVQHSNSPLAAAQGNPEPGCHEDTDPAPFPGAWQSLPQPELLLQGLTAHCTYLLREMGILCNPKAEPRQHKLGGSLQYINFNTFLPAVKINMTTNNLLRMYLLLLILLLLAGAGILRKSLRVNITYKETQLARLLFNCLNEQQTFWLTLCSSDKNSQSKPNSQLSSGQIK